MKKLYFLLLAFGLSHSIFSIDYARIARELEATSKDPSVKQIAVLPFEVINGQNAALGRRVQEELTIAFVRHTKFTVVERTLVDRALGELEFQSTGVVDADTAKALGKGIGADAIVTGTIEQRGTSYRIFARLIRTDTFTILAVSSADSQESIAPQEETGLAPTVPTTYAVDFFGGYNFSDLSITFGKPAGDYPLVDSTRVGLPGPSSSSRTVEFPNMNVNSKTPPLGIRLRMSNEGEFAFMGGIEFLYQQYAVSRQDVAVLVNDEPKQTVTVPDDYLQYKQFQLNVLMLMAYQQPDFTLAGGLVLGGNMGFLSSNVIQYYNIATNKFGVAKDEIGNGFQGAITLMGIFNLNQTFSLFVEGRYFGSFSEFDRDGKVTAFLVSEDTTVTMSGFQVYGGVGLRWQ